MRTTRALAWSCLAAAGAVAAALACTAGVHLSASAQISVGGGGGYAAMDDVPVAAGGELRLAAPQVLSFDGAPREMIAFPLRHTAIAAKVGGGLAVYDIEQVFDNPFPEPIEAVYVFPLGAHGAVSGYRMRIGERRITGEIRTRDDARREYEQARRHGYTAGLVEQVKPNIFAQRIVNIAPHETVTIDLTFVEHVGYEDGVYEMDVPLVVGPRYLPADAPGHSPVSSRPAGTPPDPGATSIPYVDASRASSTVSFTADIDAGVPIVGVTSPSHDLDITAVSPTRTRVTLSRKDELPNRDLIVRYRTAGPQTTVGLLAHRVGEDGYFVLDVQPKATYRTGDIAGREVLIVIDRSGSMQGAPIAQAKAVASGLVDSLTERDTFNILGFADGVAALAPAPIAGDAAGKARGIAYLRAMQAGGGTEMERGVVDMLTSTPGDERIRMVYFLTDGYVGNDDAVVGAAKRLLGTNRIFTVGIGSAPNRSLLDRLARAGRGFASYLTLTEQAQDLATTLVARSAHPYLTDVTVDWGGLDVRDTTPAIVPDIYAGQPLVISGRYRTPGEATIRVMATTAGRRVTIPVHVVLPARNDFEPVASLWARRQIEQLQQSADGRDVSGPITKLGLAFHLVTPYTSFVAVDRTRVVSDGTGRVVEQPAIIPEGVSPETTVGIPAAPPPSVATSSSHDDSGGGGGGGGGGWFSGGAEPSHRGLAVLALLGVLCLAARRFV